MKKVLIKYGQPGWIVYMDSNQDDFHLFKSNEGAKLVKFLCEEVASMKLDQILDARRQEILSGIQKIDEVYGRAEQK